MIKDDLFDVNRMCAKIVQQISHSSGKLVHWFCFFSPIISWLSLEHHHRRHPYLHQGSFRPSQQLLDCSKCTDIHIYRTIFQSLLCVILHPLNSGLLATIHDSAKRVSCGLSNSLRALFNQVANITILSTVFITYCLLIYLTITLK